MPMPADPLPKEPTALLSYLRAVPREDPQYLLTLYTQALALLRDDTASVEIFLDYVGVATALSEPDDVEHIYNLMKVKMRAHRSYWLGYIRFEVCRRGKPFELVFGRMMEYLRVKAFPGKDALVAAMLRDKDALLRDSQVACSADCTVPISAEREHRDETVGCGAMPCGIAYSGSDNRIVSNNNFSGGRNGLECKSGSAEYKENSRLDIHDDYTPISSPIENNTTTNIDVEPASNIATINLLRRDTNASCDLADSTVDNDSILNRSKATCVPGNEPKGMNSRMNASTDQTISFLSKRLKDLSSNTENIAMDFGQLEREINMDMNIDADMDINMDINNVLGTRSWEENKENGNNMKKPPDACKKAQRGGTAYALDILDTTLSNLEKGLNGRLRFSPMRREPYKPGGGGDGGGTEERQTREKAPQDKEAADRKGGEKKQPTRRELPTTKAEPDRAENERIMDLECDLLENTQNFKESLRSVQFPTIAFKDKEVVKISRIGRGGYSTVFRVLVENEVYALKQMRVEDVESLKICRDEILTLRRLAHGPGIIGLIDFEVNRRTVNILLEYGEVDLERIVKAGGLGLFYIKYLWQSILEVLVFIHHHRIIHRDIKPANFVLVRGRVKLIDFGISRSMRADTTSVLNVEKTGTLNYISPEQCTGGRVSRAADVWSSGCILYYMIYSKHTHESKDVMGVLRAMSEERPIEYPPADPLAIETMKLCLQYDPKKRLKAAELLEHPFLN